MNLPDKYEVEVDQDACGIELIDTDGHPVHTCPPEWTQAQVEAFLDGHKAGIALGKQLGRRALQHELRTLLGVQPR